MRRCAGCVTVCAASLWLFSGCTHMVETRVIRSFAAGLNKADLAKLRAVSSEEFERKALEGKDSMEVLKKLDIPSEKLKVVKVVEEDGVKRVTVQVGGKNGKKLVYRLEKDGDANRWVVDDVYLNRKEIQKSKAVSELVNLQVAIRQFVEAWQNGSKAAVLGTTTADFSQVLKELPQDQLAELTKRLTKDLRVDALEPKTHLGEDLADAKLSQSRSTLVVKFRRIEGHWRVEDVAVESPHDKERTPSVRQWAAAATASLLFQTAYVASDKQALQRHCTKPFFDGSLALSDLSLVKLPEPGAHKERELNLQGNVANCVLTTDKEVVKITLALQNPNEPYVVPDYRVDDVTIYELDGSQDKRLSAVFTAHALMQVFSQALVARDLETLRLSSTKEFSRSTWEQLNERTIHLMPLQSLDTGEARLLSTSFQGQVTEITVQHGELPLTYVLRDQAGKLLVDDVLVPAMDRPESLRSTLELMLPILNFTIAYESENLPLLRKESSRDFNKLVWNQTEAVPDLNLSPVQHLRKPLQAVNFSPDSAWVQLGDERFGAKVKLIKEREQYVVDDVLLVSGIEAQERVVLKRMLRVRLAESSTRGQTALAEPLGLR